MQKGSKVKFHGEVYTIEGFYPHQNKNGEIFEKIEDARKSSPVKKAAIVTTIGGMIIETDRNLSIA